MAAKKSALTAIEKELVKSVRALTKEVKNMKNLEFVKVFKNPGKFMWFAFWKGVMVGLGAIFGATVILSLVIYLLSKAELVPIVGDFVSDVLIQLEEYRGS